MIKQKLGKVVCTSLLVSAIIGTTAFAAGQEDYTAYKLPAFKGNNYTGTHKKDNARNYITNKVTAYTSTDLATFWATDSKHNQISEDYDQKVGNKSELVFTTSGFDKKDKEVCMGMENAHISTGTAFVSGWANFH